MVEISSETLWLVGRPEQVNVTSVYVFESIHCVYFEKWQDSLCHSWIWLPTCVNMLIHGWTPTQTWHLSLAQQSGGSLPAHIWNAALLVRPLSFRRSAAMHHSWPGAAERLRSLVFGGCSFNTHFWHSNLSPINLLSLEYFVDILQLYLSFLQLFFWVWYHDEVDHWRHWK